MEYPTFGEMLDRSFYIASCVCLSSGLVSACRSPIIRNRTKDPRKWQVNGVSDIPPVR